MGRFPSGQRGQTVNLLAPPSKVRILLCPVNNHTFGMIVIKYKSRCGGTGRRAGLKILLWQHSTGSIPVTGRKNRSFALLFFYSRSYLEFFVFFNLVNCILKEELTVVCGFCKMTIEIKGS